MVKVYRNTESDWYIYIMEIDCRGTKEHYFGKKLFLYTGISLDVGSRRGDYLHRRNKDSSKVGFVNQFKFSRKKLVYVSYFSGTEAEAMVVENSIKRLTQAKKHYLINSEKNMLIMEVLNKNIIILRRILDDGAEEQYLVDIK